MKCDVSCWISSLSFGFNYKSCISEYEYYGANIENNNILHNSTIYKIR